MMGAILDHLWQSTLLALGVGLMTLAFRKTGAAVRHGLWFVASVKFLVPFAALAALGGWLAPAGRPPVEAASEAAFMAQATAPFSQSFATAPASHVAAPVAQAAPGFDPSVILLVAWALGCGAILIAWAIRWARVRRAVRSATPLPWRAPMPVRASSSMFEPGLVGVWRPVLIVPKTLPDHLAQPEIDALLAHEACHLRRRDNLTAAIHMIVEALFWFHPPVWWIGARLIEERERACDETVVRSGHDRAAYARSLVECCRLYLQSPLSCVAGASGSKLKQRVETIMTAPRSLPLSRSGKALLLAAGVCAVASPVAAGWLTSPAAQQATARVAATASPGPSGVARPIILARSATFSTPGAALAEATDGTSGEPVKALPAVDVVQVSQLSLTPIANVEVSSASLLPVSSVHMPDGDQLLGPGHYEQASGPKKSLDCRDRDVGQPPRWYTLSTPLIAPGHIITNFHYELRGDNRCSTKWPSDSPSARCEVAADKPDRKAVRFQLLTDGDYCSSYTAFARDGSVHDAEAHGTITEPGAVTQSEMVISYDVQ